MEHVTPAISFNILISATLIKTCSGCRNACLQSLHSALTTGWARLPVKLSYATWITSSSERVLVRQELPLLDDISKPTQILGAQEITGPAHLRYREEPGGTAKGHGASLVLHEEERDMLNSHHGVERGPGKWLLAACSLQGIPA